MLNRFEKIRESLAKVRVHINETNKLTWAFRLAQVNSPEEFHELLTYISKNNNGLPTEFIKIAIDSKPEYEEQLKIFNIFQ